MNYIRHIKSLLPLLAALIAALTMTACNLVMEPGYDCDEPGDFVEINFRLVTGNILSRAGDDGLSPDVSEWPAFEDYINTDDLAFFIFIDRGEAGWPLLMAVTDLNDPNTAISGALGAYTLKVRIPKDDFEKVHSPLSPNSSNPVNFRMAALANTGANYACLITATESDTPIQFTEFITKAQTLSFDMTVSPAESTHARTGTTYYTGNTTDTSVASLYKGTIPMYGLLNFSVREDDLYYSSEVVPLHIGENISMLRSIAKIRVIENFTHHNEDTALPRISSVAVVSDKSQGHVLPISAEAYRNGYQVDAPNIKQEAPQCTFSLGHFGSTGKLWLGYFPEQSFGDAPVINITVVWEEDADHNPTVTEVFPVKMNRYPSTLGKNLLRNHIYTIIADIQGGVKPTLTIKTYKDIYLDPIFGLTPPKETTPPSQPAE